MPSTTASVCLPYEHKVAMSSYISNYRINYALKSHKRDALIEFIKSQLIAPFAIHVRPLDTKELNGTSNDLHSSKMRDIYKDIFASLEHLIVEHQLDPSNSHLAKLVPVIGKFFTPLPLTNAFLYHDMTVHLSARRFVPPSFNEIRAILNTAQLMAIHKDLHLITFDGDVTLYDDGNNLESDSVIAKLITTLLSYENLNVAIVTAAGYEQASRYEERLQGLFTSFRSQKVPASSVTKFWVMGGECNYLFRCNAAYHLEPVSLPDEPFLRQHAEIVKVLDVAESVLQMNLETLNLPGKIVRKSRAVGISPTTRNMTREQLDECVLSVQHALSGSPIPYCAFNGGRDCYVDIGNKLIGVQILTRYINVMPAQCLHVGDQFLSTGNDFAARSGCPTIWIASPDETADALDELISLMAK